MIALRVFPAIAILLFFVLPATTRADAFILKDGSCVVGEIYLRTSTNLFVRLTNGKSRNILLDLLDRRIEGAAAECPEVSSTPSLGSRTESSAQPTKTKEGPVGIQENEHEPRDNSEQGISETPPSKKPVGSPRSRKASVSFLGAQVKFHEARLTEPCLAVRVVPDEYLKFFQYQVGHTSQLRASIQEYVDALKDLRVNVVDELTAPLLKIDHKTQSIFRRFGSFAEHRVSARESGDGLEYDGYEALLAAQLQMPTGEIVAEFSAEWINTGWSNTNVVLSSKDREIQAHHLASVSKAWILFLAACLRVQIGDVPMAPMPTLDTTFESLIIQDKREEIDAVVKFFESSGYVPDGPALATLQALASNGVEGIDRIGPGQITRLTEIVKQDPAKRRIIKVLCAMKTEQATAALVELARDFLERGQAAKSIIKPDEHDRKLRANLKDARELLLEALASRQGPGVLEVFEQAVALETDGELRERWAGILKARR